MKDFVKRRFSHPAIAAFRQQSTLIYPTPYLAKAGEIKCVLYIASPGCKKNAPEISIVMPCLNEARSLPHCLARAFSFLESNQMPGEVIVVDNGRLDESSAVANNLGALVIEEKQKGYGAAIMAGARAARGKYIIIGDADDRYDFSRLLPFVELLRQGNELVIGNRFKGGIQKNAMPFLHRYVGNPVLSFIGKIFFKVPISDFHCGRRAIKKRKL